MLKIITLPDIHDPYQIDLKPVLDFCDDWGANIIQFLGDTTSAESCNHWKIKKHYKRDVISVDTDFKNLEKNVIKPFWQISGNTTKLIYHTGNHEDWFIRTMKSDDKAAGLYDIKNRINCKKYKMTIIPENKPVNFGHLWYTHGIYAGKYHARQTLEYFRKCVVYGHTHDIQEHMIHSPIDEAEKLFAKSIGCLCNLNPDYLKEKPNKWVNAFHIAYIRDDGTFNEYTIVITNGRFTAPNGRVYK